MKEFDFEKAQSSKILGGFEKAKGKKAKQKFEPGEISPTTGLQKQPDGSWAPPKEGIRKPKPEEDEGAEIPGGLPADVVTQVKNALENNGAKTRQIKAMWEIGLSPEQMVYASGGNIELSYCEHIHRDKGYEPKNEYPDATLDNIAIQLAPESTIAEQVKKEKRISERTSDRDVDKMIKIYRTKIKTVALGLKKALIVYGTGGLGKSYNMLDVLKNEMKYQEYDPQKHDLGSDSYDFVVIKGKSGERDIYTKLFEHNGKMIIFDDADEAVKASGSGTNPTTNLLKAALDTSEKTYVSHPGGMKTKKIVPGQEPDKNDMYDVPGTFKFEGTFMAITNLPPDKMPQPIIQSRALDMDLSMSREETVELMEHIAPDMKFYNNRGDEIDIPKETVQDAVNFIKVHAKDMPIGRLNARTLQNVAVLKYVVDQSGDDSISWRDLAEDELYD